MTLPRVEIKAIQLLSTGAALSKYDLARMAPCVHKTAQRVLKKLHSMNQVRIIGWQKIYRQRIPIYHYSVGSDMPKPAAVDNPARQRQLRQRKKWN